VLNDAQITKAKRKPKPYKLFDRDGLYLVVPPTGRKRWRYDFRLHGNRRTLAIGVYPDVTLAKARQKLAEARALVADGQDPVRARKLTKIAEQAAAYFQTLAEDWELRKLKGLAPATVKKKRGILYKRILPRLGRIRVKDLRPSDVLGMVRDIESDGLGTTPRTALEIVGEILRYGVATEQAERDVTGDLVDALEPMTVTHRASITDPPGVGALMRAIDSMRETPQLRSALRLLAFTFVRPGELRLSEWTEVNLEAALWKVPKERTKQRADHHVPLSRQAVEEFRTLKDLARGSRFVLPTPRTILRPLSDAAFLAALSRIGYSSDVMTPHGFRAMARTLLDEQLHEPPDAIEAQLAHATRGALGDTYNRSRYLAHRTAMMQRYADYLDALARG